MNANHAGDGTRRSRAGRVHSPSRERILSFIQECATPVELASIAENCQLHENTVRAQLDALLADGYLERTPGQAAGRGRPPWLWSVPRRVANPFAGLATALARQVISTSQRPADEALAAGEAWGQDLAHEYLGVQNQDADPVPAVNQILDIMGFAPQAPDAQGKIGLHACPMLDAATQYPQVVCNVHRGIVRGVLGALGHEDHEVSLIPFKRPGCCELSMKPARERNQ